jgi:hypothetical protein
MLLADFAWGAFLHRPYSPVLAPSDFHLFTHLNILDGTHMSSDKEVKKTKTGLMDWWQISMMQAYRNSSDDMTSA